MFNAHRVIGGSLFVLFLFTTALAQENRASMETPRETVVVASTAPMVTATATAERVRFVSPGTVVQLRLEVYNETGQKLFDTELHGGNVMDWQLQDGAGQRLPAGSYACVLTIKSLSGRLSQRVGLVMVNNNNTAVEAGGKAQLSTAQQQIIGPVEGNAAFIVLQESETEAITAITHDGSEGQVARTRGPLSFRVGDFFSGKDREQMRLTEEGNLGIGTDKPEATLDVAGMIRAREGLMFSDGSTLNVNEKGVLTRTAADDASPSAVTATQDRIVKFTDNAGTLGDSGITENAAGLVGIDTTNPQTSLHIGPNTGYGSTTGLLVTSNLTGSQFDRAFQLAPRQTANPAINSILMYVLPTVNNNVTVPRQYGLFVDAKQGAGTVTSYAAIGTGQTATLGATNNTHLLMGSLQIPPGNFAIFDNTGHKSFFNGDVGIGTSNPTSKLDVAGAINTSRQYNIDGRRILSNAGTDNLFAGRDAGNSNTTGIFNAFFGVLSGTSNTTGFSNSFFGVTSGTANTSGGNNSFFGVRAGNANSTGGSNSFFGLNAGLHNTTASNNSFFGASAGQENTIGNSNAFFGFQAGQSNTLGGRNSFFGFSAGSLNEAGVRNSSFGTEAGMSNTGQDNVFVGDKAGMLNTQGILNTFVGAGAAEINATGSNNTAIGAGTVIPEGLSFATVIGAGAEVQQDSSEADGDNTVTLGRRVDEVHAPGSLRVGDRRSIGDEQKLTVTGSGIFTGTLEVGTLGTVGAESLCRNIGTHKIAVCSSSLRYKTDIGLFSSGLKLVNSLQPISFTWKEAGNRDLGLGAEDVEKLEPLLVTYNDKGEVEGVKYDRLAVVLLNAVKEQQSLITRQERQLNQHQSASLELRRKLEQQQQQLDALRKLVCKKNPRAKACK